MDASATVRVRSDSTASSGERPDRDKVQRAADLLAEQGFEVLRVGRYGVNVKADEQAFRDALGVDLKPNVAAVDVPRPSNSELLDLIDLVEVASLPTSFP